MIDSALQRFIAGYQTADQTCARQERDLRAFAKKAGYKVVGVWKEIASRAKQDRAARKQLLALRQARKVDVILVTELTRWDRSASSISVMKSAFVMVGIAHFSFGLSFQRSICVGTESGAC